MKLPQVAGSMECSASEFERRCRFYIGEEQRKMNQDNGLISVLCDGVRMAREFAGKPLSKQFLEAAKQAVAEIESDFPDCHISINEKSGYARLVDAIYKVERDLL